MRQKFALADMADIDKFVAGLEFNGDGVIHPSQVADAEPARDNRRYLKFRGSVPDVGGEAGINQEISDAFFSEVAAYSDWLAKGDDDEHVQFLDEKTQAAADAFHAVKDKVNDYFTRCQLAAYDARAAGPLSRSTEDYQHIAAQSLSAQNTDIAGFPLATVEPNKPLPLNSGINPAWQSQIEALRKQAIEPVFGKKDELSLRNGPNFAPNLRRLKHGRPPSPPVVLKSSVMRVCAR